ncbi:TonB-dependent receptor plug domain-containing protein [Rubritalea tangerina]|uniref:TonB-dependent receptor plug domain-containing protein n=1 Tax=Rubritalea tangerina TaxID=430798 RepID=A0ABW4Z8G4_9BACT
MTTSKSPSVGVKVVAGLMVAGQVSAVADDAKNASVGATDTLDPTTVLASRFENPVDKTVSSVSVVPGQEIELKQQNRLLDALNDLPGIQGLSTAGQTGAFGSIIVRGLPTKYTQVVVDGVRITDSTNGLNNFLTNAQTSQITQLELLRGPQSVLYGSEAAAGVIGFNTAVGEGDPSYSLFGEAGSFDSYRVAASAQGQVQDLQYAIELNTSFTSNDTYEAYPLQDYSQDSAVLALQWLASEDLRFKLSYRGSSNKFLAHTIDNFGETRSDTQTDIHLLAFNTSYVVNPDYQTHLTFGYYDEESESDTDYGFGPSPYNTKTDRFSINWSNQWVAHDTFTMVGGVDYNKSDYENTNDQKVDYSNVGLYANGFWTPVENLLIELGGRYDEHDTHGGDVAWNVGGGYTIDQTNTRLRARTARSFRTPTLLDSGAFVTPFGVQVENDGLKTETILGYELGLDQEIVENHELQVTYFYQSLEDAIANQVVSPGSFFPVFSPTVSQRVNLEGDSLVSGVESALAGSFVNQTVQYRLAWTAQIKEEVIDVPDHIFSGDVYYDADKWVLGAGASYVGSATYGQPGGTYFLPTDSRFVARLYGNYQIHENLKLHGRLENLFDEKYNVSDSIGGPIQGQGFGAFGGLTLSF